MYKDDRKFEGQAFLLVPYKNSPDNNSSHDRDNAHERSCMYLALHELESVIVM